MRNIEAHPAVAVLADAYDEDWSRLWWCRADGRATVVGDGPGLDAAVAALAAKYPQYRDEAPAGPAILIEVTRWSGWTAK